MTPSLLHVERSFLRLLRTGDAAARKLRGEASAPRSFAVEPR